MAKSRKKEIKDCLIKQLEEKGANIPVFMSMIDEYMDLYNTRELLREDIKKRGACVYYDNGGGQKGAKKNDSIDQILKVSKQMVSLLSYLNIKVEVETDGEVEL